MGSARCALGRARACARVDGPISLCLCELNFGRYVSLLTLHRALSQVSRCRRIWRGMVYYIIIITCYIVTRGVTVLDYRGFSNLKYR